MYIRDLMASLTEFAQGNRTQLRRALPKGAKEKMANDIEYYKTSEMLMPFM